MVAYFISFISSGIVEKEARQIHSWHLHRGLTALLTKTINGPFSQLIAPIEFSHLIHAMIGSPLADFPSWPYFLELQYPCLCPN